jgi:hypothetical protein
LIALSLTETIRRSHCERSEAISLRSSHPEGNA